MKKILTTAVLGLALIFGSATMAFAASTGGTNPDSPDLVYPGSVQIDSQEKYNLQNSVNNQLDNNIGNANQTGLNVNDTTSKGDVIKSQDMNLKYDKDGKLVTGDTVNPVTQRTHGEYQNNTNSCASCHQTHTGAADNLLFKSSIYDTCTACHDGTLGFYNVFGNSTAGTFGGTAEGNASVHMANGSMEVKAAPGGNTAEKGSKVDGLGEEIWTGEFTCASCHSPHGSYSSRLLNFNPNGIASVPYYDADGSYLGTPGTPGKTGGQMVRDVVLPTLPDAATATQDFVVWQTTANTAVVKDATTDATVRIIDDATLTKYSVATTAQTVVVMKRMGDAHAGYYWARDNQPWIFGGEFRDDHSYKVNFTKFYTGAPKSTVSDDTPGSNNEYSTGVTYFYQGGFAKVTNSVVGKNADISRAYVVTLTMDPDNYEWFGSANSGVKIEQVSPFNYSDSAEGPAISTFCGACHTDYLTSSSNDQPGTGVWSKAFRHTTTSSSYTCLKCHFAHGTDVTVMMDAQDRDVKKAADVLFGNNDGNFTNDGAAATDKATAYLLDKNASSALKRYTNMSVCWKCHTSSHSVGTMNNDYVYNVKYDTDKKNDLTPGFKAPDNNSLPYFKATANVVDETVTP